MSDGRRAALAALLAIEAGQQAGPALDAALAQVEEPRERRLATELAFGVTRWQASLDGELGTALVRPLPSLQPAVRATLRLGLYQLRHMRVPAHAAVDTSVRLAREHAPAAAGLINAVLRRVAQRAPEPSQDLAEAYSHPPWLVERWLERLGRDETRRLLEENNRAPGITLRANRLRTTAEALRAELDQAGIPSAAGRWLPEAVRLPSGGTLRGLSALTEGRCTVQGEGSMLVGHAAAPEPGWFCLDVAAAPGGKATHLAELMGDRGTVVANDISAGRAEVCRANAVRLGLGAVRTHVADVRDLPATLGDRCDLVLADLPCSGLGTLAQRPDLRWRKRPQDIPAMAALQAELLAAAARCVRPGGRLVYSTCTTEPEENEAVVAGLLSERPDFEPENVVPRLPADLAADPALGAGLVRLWPQRHGTEGFFIAVLRRTADQGAGGRRP